jgi:uncharacterized protein YgiM (DUF1202 family)
MAETLPDASYPALASPHCAKGTARARGDGLRVRKTAPAGEVLGYLAQSQQVTVWAVADGWAIVQAANGLTGWVSLAYLTPAGELLP